MLYRKIESKIHEHFTSGTDKILIVIGARQVGKSYIIRHAATKVYQNVVEINLIDDYEGERLFGKVKSTDDFYLTVGAIFGAKLGEYDDTLIFLDEIQQYPHLLTLLKFLREEHRYHIVASGSLLGIALQSTTSIPIGSISLLKMFPLDFEEFMIANGVGEDVITAIRQCFTEKHNLPEGVHNHVMSLFRRYLLVGGLPEAVNEYIATHNIGNVRSVQMAIHRLYSLDASKYDLEHRLMISRIYEMIPSNMENKKKRLVFKDIENKNWKRSSEYMAEIDYLSASGVALEVNAVSNPSFPLPESGRKNLLKLYLNDVGLLTAILYRNNIRAVLDDECSVNLGAVYESVVAMELAAHEHALYYYDNKTKGEVDFIIDDYSTLSSIPIEVKSGKDYNIHTALTRLVDNSDYRVNTAYLFSNEREIMNKGSIWYMPVYYVMCLDNTAGDPDQIF